MQNNRPSFVVRFGYCVALVLFGYLALLVHGAGATRFDTWVFSTIASLHTPGLTAAMQVITGFGDMVLVGIVAITFLSLFAVRRRIEAVIFLCATAGAALLNTALKFLVARPRPPLVHLVVETGYSFPSGHSADSFVVYLTLAFGMWYFSHNKRFAGVAGFGAVVFILLIGFSRIYLGVHYPTDVLGGYLEGALWLSTVYMATRRWLGLSR